MIKILNDKRIIVTMLVLQTLTLFAVYISWQPASQIQQNNQVLAESIQEDPDQVYRNCLSKPVAAREACAREIGQTLAGDLTLSGREKVGSCMKLRPIFVRYCLEELR